jgi:hypothetical protein
MQNRQHIYIIASMVALVGLVAIIWLLSRNNNASDEIIIEHKETGCVANITKTNIEQAFKFISSDAGFHARYPAYIPSELELRSVVYPCDKSTESYRISLVSYELGDINSDLPWIGIAQEKVEDKQTNMILNKVERLISKQEVFINNNPGFYGTTGDGTNAPKFFHLILSTTDGIAIWLRTKHYDIDTLVRVAESMK